MFSFSASGGGATGIATVSVGSTPAAASACRVGVRRDSIESLPAPASDDPLARARSSRRVRAGGSSKFTR